MAGRLRGKVAIVTGAGSSGDGIGNGKATALLFAREGASVLCVDIVPERAEATCNAIRAEGGQAVALAADVTRRDECERMVATAVARFGRLDILHNNVGIVSHDTVRDVTEDVWERVLAVNLKSMVFACQAAVPRLEAAGGGSIITVSSLAALRAFGPGTAYQTSKAGVIGLTVSLAGQLAPHRIRVNCIAPGAVWTPLVAAYTDAAGREARRRLGLLQDEGTAWDVAWAAVYLASDESRWVTGQVLIIDGGASVAMRSAP